MHVVGEETSENQHVLQFKNQGFLLTDEQSKRIFNLCQDQKTEN